VIRKRRRDYEVRLERDTSVGHALHTPCIVDGSPVPIRNPCVKHGHRGVLEFGKPFAVDELPCITRKLRGVLVTLLLCTAANAFRKGDRLEPPDVIQHELLTGAFQEYFCGSSRLAVPKEFEEFGLVVVNFQVHLMAASYNCF